MIRRQSNTIAIISMLIVSGVTAAAQDSDISVPATIDFRGVIYGTDGATPQSTDRDLYVRIFEDEDEVNGDEAWSGAFEGTSFRDGAYVLQLGNGNNISGSSQSDIRDIFKGSLMWLGISFDSSTHSDNNLKAIASVPYALSANRAESATHGVPPGTISIWCGSNQADSGIPEGWLLCDGDAYSEDAYPALFAAIGDTWNSAEVEQDSFNVPNFGGRALMGINTDDNPGDNANSSFSYENASDEPTNASLTTHELGDMIGEEKHLLKTSELPSHTHSYDDHFANDNDRRHRDSGNATPKPHRGSDSRTRTTDPKGGDTPHNNNQPSRVVTYIIKY